MSLKGPMVAIVVSILDPSLLADLVKPSEFLHAIEHLLLSGHIIPFVACSQLRVFLQQLYNIIVIFLGSRIKVGENAFAKLPIEITFCSLLNEF